MWQVPAQSQEPRRRQLDCDGLQGARARQSNKRSEVALSIRGVRHCLDAVVGSNASAIDAAMPALTSALAHLLNDEALPLGGASLNVFGELLGDSSTVEPRTLTPLAPVHITRHFRVSQFRE
jgi:hypothetical protein